MLIIYLLGVTVFLAPSYIIRFVLFGLPANILLVWVVLVWVVFLWWALRHKKLSDFIQYSLSTPYSLLITIGLFFIASIFAMFVSGLNQTTFGQWLVLFVEPVSIFFIVRYICHVFPQTRDIVINFIYIFLGLSGLYAVAQYFTLWGLPVGWWGNSNEPKRAISFFVHPNGYALFITPILAFLLPDMMQKFETLKGFKLQASRYTTFYGIAWFIGAMGLFLSLSRGGWLGLAAALIVLLLMKFDKRLWRLAVAVMVIVIVMVVIVPNLRYRLILPFYGEKSAVARLSLWHTGWQMIQDNPILGKGLTGFSQNWYEYNTDPNLDHYNFPHNIALNFWVDTGLLGLISFFGIMFYGLNYAWQKRSNVYAFGLGLFLVAILVHGIIDIPYLKNDLALMFWLIWGLALVI